VLIGASFIGDSAYPGPFDSTPVPGTERLASIVDTMLTGDFIAENPSPWPVLVIGIVAILAAISGVAGALLPTRLAALSVIVPMLLWGGGPHGAFLPRLWLPVVAPLAALVVASGGVLLFRYGFVERQRRAVQTAFRHYLAPELVNDLAAHPERLQLGGET